ncbi:MAG: ABC transporter substrate-binding protein [Candidatus Delongbacteria bacterium]|nr:ABC transporter substrate-binding protein [Candidatus Delongbacteria bacterium]
MSLRIVGLMIVLGLIVSCGGKNGTDQNGPRLSIISPHSKDVIDNFDRAFKQYYKQRTGQEITMEWIGQGGTSDDLKFIRSEFSNKPDGIGIDMFWGGGLAPHLDLKEQGLLQPLSIDTAILNGIPAELSGIPMYDPEFYWYGGCLSAFGIIYNKMVLQQLAMSEPADWSDLAKKEYFDWLSMPDVRHSGSIEMMFQMILQAYGWDQGWEILTLICANSKRFTLSSIDVIKDITTGDAACALSVDYYAWKQIETLGKDKIGYSLPTVHAVVNPDCISILKGLPHPDESRIFLEFMLSEQGQALFYLPHDHPQGPPISSLYRLPILPKAYRDFQAQSLIPINPFDNYQMVRYDAVRSQMLWDIFKDLCGVLFIDNYNDLHRCWSKIKDSDDPALIRDLSVPPIDSVTMDNYAAQWRKDELFRNQKLNEWTKFAVEKYSRLSKKGRP